MFADIAEDTLIAQALAILQSRLQERDAFSSPDDVKSFLRLQVQGLDHEVFAVMFLDAGHRLIAYERVFRGTLTHTTVHARELVKRALALNAAAVILHHNHPSGRCMPSQSDEAVTAGLQRAFALMEVRVLDHVITSDAEACSMREMGLV